MDKIFLLNRRIASKLSVFLIQTPLKPNHVTIFSMACGFIAALFMSKGTRWALLQAAFFMQLSFILDNCDGEIARAKKLSSEFGMWLDYVADLFVDFAIWIGLSLGAYRFLREDWVYAVAIIACLGSFINFNRVIWERRLLNKKKREEMRSTNKFIATLQILGDDGDPSLLFWVLALIAGPQIILICGAVYIHFLWMFGLWNLRKISV